jgi:hypothetical protein
LFGPPDRFLGKISLKILRTRDHEKSGCRGINILKRNPRSSHVIERLGKNPDERLWNGASSDNIAITGVFLESFHREAHLSACR